MTSIKSEEYDTAMEEAFKADYDKVRSFITGTVGEIKKGLVSREFYYKQCDYMNFLPALAISAYPVDISLSATLLIDGKVPAGEVRYQDIRKVYPYENKLVVLRLTGAEILKYLEASYDAWINTVTEPYENAHVLKIKQSKDYSTGKMAWKLAKSPANFDSAAGINYTVDVTKPYGSRVVITDMADGSKFELDKEYTAAITTYRSVGSGGLLKAAGLEDMKSVEARSSERFSTGTSRRTEALILLSLVIQRSSAPGSSSRSSLPQPSRQTWNCFTENNEYIRVDEKDSPE